MSASYDNELFEELARVDQDTARQASWDNIITTYDNLLSSGLLNALRRELWPDLGQFAYGILLDDLEFVLFLETVRGLYVCDDVAVYHSAYDGCLDKGTIEELFKTYWNVHCWLKDTGQPVQYDTPGPSQFLIAVLDTEQNKQLTERCRFFQMHFL